MSNKSIVWAIKVEIREHLKKEMPFEGIVAREAMSPLAMVSATFSPWPEHLLVLMIETIDIEPLATSSSA